MKLKQFVRQHRRVLTAVASCLLVLLIVALNILLPYLTRSTFIDLTPEGLYTLTDAMKQTCGALKGEITIIFCAPPDDLMTYYQSRYVYAMAVQLDRMFDNITVEWYDIEQNPTAVNRFRPTSATRITPYDVIVTCNNRYRILSAVSFWTVGESAESDTDYYSFNGEYKLATALLSITSTLEPLVCFAYGHGERFYVDPTDTEHSELLPESDANRSAFYHLLQDAGLKVSYINLDEEDVPEDCALLVMDGPTVDYSVGNPNSVSEVTPLRRLHKSLARESGAMMLLKDPTVTLPNLEDFSEDWGIGFGGGEYIRDDAAHTLSDSAGTRQKLIVSLTTDDESGAYAVYSDLADLGTAPRMIVEDAGTVHGSWLNASIGGSGTENVTGYYYDFFTSSQGAYLYTVDGYQASQTPASYAPAGLAMRLFADSYTGDTQYSYLLAAATTALTENTYLDNRAYCNYDLMFATVRYLSRMDEYASIELGGTSLNSPNPGGKPLMETDLDGVLGYPVKDEIGITRGYYPVVDSGVKNGWTLTLVLVPVLLCTALGAFLLIKRKNK